jgi:hypothetical protein
MAALIFSSFAPENAAGIDAGLSIRVGNAGSIAH